MTIADIATPQQGRLALGFRPGPPGLLFLVVTLFVIAVTLELSSRSSDVWELAILWLVIGGAWLVRVAMSVSEEGLRPTFGRLRRWLVIPAAFAFALTLMWSRVLFDVRRDLSTPAFNTLAADFQAGGSVDREWVGLYPTGEFESTADGFRFVVADGVFDRHGHAYATDGEPTLTEANFAPGWTGTRFLPIGDGWWYWTETWD